jgi:pimeloyl-ACP methyl ester carboxylesterase
MNGTHKSGYADVSIGQLHYAVRHNSFRKDGSALLLMNSRARSSLQLMPLLNRYERIFSVELPAFGMSSPMPAGCSMLDIAAVIHEFVSVMGIAQLDLFGLHSGHKVAAALAANWPEKVRRMIVAGRTHSLIPDHQARNKAMKRTLDENHPDISILRMEGKYVDDIGGPIAFANIFEANFAFDFAEAMQKIRAPTLILEILSDLETGWYGAQATKLSRGMRDVLVKGERQIDPTGLDLYIGAAPMADIISSFMEG